MLSSQLRILLAVGLAAALFRCAPRESAAANAETPASTSTAAIEAATPRSVVGAWTSPSCGDRKFERRLRFDPNGKFVARDLVSPCPAGAKCIWSGIVDRSGTYVVTSTGVALKIANAGPTPQLPSTLDVDAATGAPSESNGAASCAYAPFDGAF